jgi:hypothetical protein
MMLRRSELTPQRIFIFSCWGAGLAGTTVLQWIFPRLFYLYITPLNLSVLTCVVARCLNLITVKFTILQPASAGGMPIRIIHDEKHDEVLARIRSGWIARLRKLHLQIDVTNDAKTEARRFKWLLDHGVISDAEYQTAIARLSPDVSVPAVGGEQAIH